VVILVSGGGKEMILAVPKIAAGTGEQQANACRHLTNGMFDVRFVG
jgi:hypothetical protein